MISTRTCDLSLATLNPTACRGHIIPALTSGALLSLGQLCDDNCHVILHKYTIKIYKGDKIILAGDRDFTTGIWIVNVPHSSIPPLIYSSPRSTTLPPDSEIPRIPFQVEPSVPNHCNSVYEQKTLQVVAKFLHAACFSPALQTFIDAINAGFFTSWPGLNAVLISKHLPKSEATTLGHLDQTRKNIRSTKVYSETSTPQQSARSIDSIASPMRTNIVLVSMPRPSKLIYSDLTGHFPVKSARGNQYIFLLYDCDSNTIHVRPLRSRTETAIVAAYDSIHAHLCARGLTTELQRLDNEASAALQLSMQTKKVNFQLVPPHNYRRNAAERCIHTFKDHFIVGVCSTHPNFPLNQ